MGKQEAIQQYQQEQKQRFAQQLDLEVKAVHSIYDSTKWMDARLDEILTFPAEVTDRDGKVYRIEGEHNDREKGTFGIKDIFEDPQFKKRPFKEASRCTAQHFRMYCLVNGVSAEEMLSLGGDNPDPQAIDKMQHLKLDFYKMILNRDMNAIGEFYGKLCSFIEARSDTLMQLDREDGVRMNRENMQLLWGSATYLLQTLELSDPQLQTPEQKTLIADVNRQLKEQGKLYKLEEVQEALYPMNEVIQSVFTSVNVERTGRETYAPMTYQQIMTGDEEYGDTFGIPTLTLMNAKKITKEVRKDALADRIDPNGLSRVPFLGMRMTGPCFDLKNMPAIAQKVEQNQTRAPLELAERMGNNVRKGIFGTKKNSKEYDDVLKAVRLVAEQEKNMSEMRAAGVKPNAAQLKLLGDACKELARVSKTYLDNRDPRSDEGIARYKLVLEAADLAKSSRRRTLEAGEGLKQMQNPENVHLRECMRTMRVAADIGAQNTNLRKNLNRVLKERFVHKDKNGVERIIEGEHNDPKKGTLGVFDVFGPKSEFYGQPFLEVSRNMDSHFKMFCLYKGMTEKDLKSLAGEHFPIGMRDRLTNLKKEFFDMIIDRDMDKIADMYASAAMQLEQDGERFRAISPTDCSTMERDPMLFVKYAGGQSWYGQTLNYGTPKVTPEATKLVNLVNQKLKDAGKDYGFDIMNKPIKECEWVTQTGAEFVSKLADEKIIDSNVILVNWKLIIASVADMKESTRQPFEKGSWLGNLKPDPHEEGYARWYGKSMSMPLGQFLGEMKTLEQPVEQLRQNGPVQQPVQPVEQLRQNAPVQQPIPQPEQPPRQAEKAPEQPAVQAEPVQFRQRMEQRQHMIEVQPDPRRQQILRSGMEASERLQKRLADKEGRPYPDMQLDVKRIVVAEMVAIEQIHPEKPRVFSENDLKFLSSAEPGAADRQLESMNLGQNLNALLEECRKNPEHCRQAAEGLVNGDLARGLAGKIHEELERKPSERSKQQEPVQKEKVKERV